MARGRMVRRGAWLAGALALCVAIQAGGARAEDDPLARAEKLRNDSAADWKQEDYAAAAAKLEEALAIYDRVEGESALDRAITIRALVWNRVRAGRAAEAQAILPRLMALAAGDEALYPELRNAWSAVWEAANAMADADQALEYVADLRAEAQKAQLDLLVGQAWHDMGSIARGRDRHGDAADYYAKAIAVRRGSGDAVGEAWSRNNLANMLLLDGNLEAALPHLAAAYALVHTSAVVPPQSAIAWNLRKAISMMKAEPGASHVTWLLERAKVAREEGQGLWVPPEHLERAALAVAVARGKAAEIERVAKSLTALPADPEVPEIAADLEIRAAQALAGIGKGSRAKRRLEELDVGSGPCRPHLEARRLTALALCLADKRGKKRFPDAAADAAKAWRDLGDFAGRREALAAIVQAAEAAELSEDIAAVVTEYEDARRAGGPGGAGGSATSGGDRARAGDVPLHGVVFEIRCKDDTIHVRDRVATHATQQAVKWRPLRFGINGLRLMIFGGYVVVEGMDYGGGAAGASSPGAITLDELGVYLPLPEDGGLLIQKNGAVRYGRASAPVSGR